MIEGKFCSYMQTVCSGSCEYAYENRHGSAGYCCLRPDTRIERLIKDLRLKIYHIKEAVKQIETLINKIG